MMQNELDEKLYAEVIQKAWDDKDFKSQLLEDPLSAIEKLTGGKLDLPVGKTLMVRDQTDESIVHINIPSRSYMDSQNKIRSAD